MRFLYLLFFLLLTSPIFSQSSAFGIKGGMTLGIQQWNAFDRDPLFKYHGIVYVESYDEDNNENALFAQAGYHVKGSAIRNARFRLNNGNIGTFPTQEFRFHNASLTLGAKKKFDVNSMKGYYLLGIRGDYNLFNNLDEYSDDNIIFLSYPQEQWVRRFTYGATVGGGFEFMFSELVGGVVELTVNPDLSRQYIQPPLDDVPDPLNPGNSRSISERRITNITLELTVGLRFLRIVEYID
jgi:hypothetical protein